MAEIALIQMDLILDLLVFNKLFTGEYRPNTMLGKIIKDARESASLTQTKLAKESKIALSTLSCIESGKRNPTKEVARRIAKALGIPEQDLTKYCNREKHAIGEGKIIYIPLQHLPIARRLTKVRAENLSQVDQLISEILEKQKNEINNHD